MISGMSTMPDMGFETGRRAARRAAASSDRRAKKTTWAAT